MGGPWAVAFKAKVMMMRTADVFLPKLSFYLSTYLFFPGYVVKLESREPQKLAQGYLGWSAADLGPGLWSPPQLAPCPVCRLTLISIRVACCGLRTSPDAAFPNRYLFASKVPVTVCWGFSSQIHRTFSPHPGWISKCSLRLTWCKESTGNSESRSASNSCMDYFPSLCLSCLLCRMGRKIIPTYLTAGRSKGEEGWKALWEPISYFSVL